MQLEHKTISYELKSKSSDGSKWDGHGNTFYCIDSAQEIVDLGAFTDTLPQFLQDGTICGLNHNWDEPIGRPLDAKEDNIGLWLDALCDVDSNEARKCRDLIQKRIIKKLSIGYRVKASEWLETAEDVADYWKSRGYTPRPEDAAAAQYGARLLTKLHLYEVSPVTVPANTYSTINHVKRISSGEIETERQFEKFLRDAGFSRDAARTLCAGGFKALRQRDVEEQDTETIRTAETPTAEVTEAKQEETGQAETPTLAPVIEPAIVVPVIAAVTLSKADQLEVGLLYSQFSDRQTTMNRRR